MLFKLRSRRQHYINRFFQSLNVLQKKYFFCYLEQNYWDERYVYEWQIYHAHQKLFQATRAMRAMQPAFNMPLYEKVYQLTCSLGNLRFRISDRAVFELCKNEFTRITQLLASILRTASSRRANIKDILSSLDQFTHAIFDLEDLWQGALRVTDPEPLVFLFFIQDLNRWHQSVLVLVKDIYA